MTRTLSRRKFFAFAALAITISIAGMLLVLLAADLLLHWRAERSAGLNRHGYRGPVVGRKQPGELRIVMLGGSTVFGYGVLWNEAIPFQLEARLRERLGRPVSVVNLGYNNEGAYAFAPHLEDFAYLDYDLVILYEGYNDLGGDLAVNRAVYRRDSAIYRLTGYFPILPLYLEEKAMILRHGGNLEAGYAAARSGKTVFNPTLAQRTGAGALDAVAMMTKALDTQLARVSAVPAKAVVGESTLGCPSPWLNYCESVSAAIRFARARGTGVVVASQPAISGDVGARHRQQQDALRQMLATHFRSDPAVVWADLSQTIDLHNADLAFDGMHLSPAGNAIVTARLLAPVLAALEARSSS